MKLPLSLGVFALAGFVALEAEAGQQSLAIERGQKARPDPVTQMNFHWLVNLFFWK
jgi:hypothetical protein